MTEALELLKRQPMNWPRWQPGWLVNGALSNKRHMFIFIPSVVDGEVKMGSIRPACHFVDGSERVEYDNQLNDHDRENWWPSCHTCLEVELQHWCEP